MSDVAMARRVGMHALLLFAAFAAGELAGMVTDGTWTPVPVAVQALISGCITALFAVGLVLIYRASRIINFAHAGFGGVGAVLMLMLIRELELPYYLALAAGLGAAVALGLVVELFFVQRFFKAPRLVLTVVTIGIAGLLGGLARQIPRFFGPPEDVRAAGREESPLSHISLDWFPVRFSGDHLVLVGITVAVLVAMALFFRYTSAGIAVRAAAENDDKAALLGINVRTLSSVVWGLAALLSGLAAVADVPIAGVPQGGGGAGIGSALLLRALAAGVIARMENLPLAVTAALGLSVFEQLVFFAANRTDITQVVLLAVILGGLLVQRRRMARAEGSVTGTWTATEEIRPVPKELAHLPSVRKGARGVALVVAASLLLYPWVASPSQTNLGGLFAIYGIIAVSLVILIGWGGQVSLGQFGFVAVGALVGGALTAKWDVWFPLAALAGSAVGGGVAILLGLPALRIRGLFLAVTTLGFSVVTAVVLLSEQWFGWLLPDVVNRPKFAFIDTEDERSFYYLTIVCLALAVLAARGLRQSRTGRVLIAMRDNERTAQSFGVNLVRTRLATFALSGFLAAFAGVLYAHHQHAVTQEAFPPEQSITMFLMAVIGGLGSVTGVLLGPLYVGLSEVVLSDDFQWLASPVGVLVVLMFLPTGLGGLAYSLRDSYLRRVAIRHRIFVPSLLADYRTDAHMSRVPLAPKIDVDGNPVGVPVRYRLRSRIGVAGASQRARRWSF